MKITRERLDACTDCHIRFYPAAEPDDGYTGSPAELWKSVADTALKPNEYVVDTPYIFADGDGLALALKYQEGIGWYYTDEGHTFFHLEIAYDSFSASMNKPRVVHPDVPMWETISARYQIEDVGLTEQGKRGDVVDWIKYGVSVCRYPSGDDRIVGELIRKITTEELPEDMSEFSEALTDFIQGLFHIIYATETREWFREQGVDV